MLAGFDLVPHLVSLTIAYGLAVPIGWNREKQERSAGLRTFPLVALGGCGIVLAVDATMGQDADAMSRVLDGAITAIGFLGGGAILQQRGSVKGTATAASLWVTGAMGIACGLGSYDVAVLLALLTMATLWFLAPLKPDANERVDAADGDGSNAGTPNDRISA